MLLKGSRTQVVRPILEMFFPSETGEHVGPYAVDVTDNVISGFIPADFFSLVSMKIGIIGGSLQADDDTAFTWYCGGNGQAYNTHTGGGPVTINYVIGFRYEVDIALLAPAAMAAGDLFGILIVPENQITINVLGATMKYLPKYPVQ